MGTITERFLAQDGVGWGGGRGGAGLRTAGWRTRLGPWKSLANSLSHPALLSVVFLHPVSSALLPPKGVGPLSQIPFENPQRRALVAPLGRAPAPGPGSQAQVRMWHEKGKKLGKGRSLGVILW